MSTQHTVDAIVIGGGHNGLVCAASLAQDGRRTVLVEAADVLGGIGASRALAEGYNVPGLLHDTARLRPKVVTALELEDRHGLVLRDRPDVAVLRAGQSPLMLGATDCEGASEHDRRAYRDYRAVIHQFRTVFGRVVDTEPPNISGERITGLWDAMLTGWSLRRLGSAALYEFLRLPPMPVNDWMDELFDDPILQAALAFPIALGGFTGPRAPGTVATLMLEECTANQEVVGGPPALIRSLVSACEAHRVDVRTGSEVRRIRLETGCVRGVDLADGTTIDAPVVVATCDPRRTFLDLLHPAGVSPSLLHAAENIRARGTVAKVHLAVEGSCPLTSEHGDPIERFRLVSSLDDMERASDTVKYGEMFAEPPLEVQVTPSDDSGTRGYVLSVIAGYVAHDLNGGWNEAQRAALGDHVVHRLAAHIPDISKGIIAREVLSPVDLAQQYRLSGGHLYHGEHALDQILFMRPMARCANHKTPVEGLFLGGSGTHPGGGFTGGPGWLSARAVL